MIKKILSVILIFIILVYMLREKIWIIIAIIILIILIRFGADIFWWGKDNDKW